MYFGFTSCPASWRKFDLEFRTPAYNKGSLLSSKTVEEEKGKLDLDSLSARR